MTESVPEIPLTQAKQKLYERMVAEARANRGYALGLELPLNALLAVAGHLQLALRHPGNQGPSREIAESILRNIVQHLRDTGMPATAEAIELGEDPAYDE